MIPKSPKFFVWQNEQQQGPFEQEIIQQMISERKITSETLVCPDDGGLDWTPAKKLFFPGSGGSWGDWEQATAPASSPPQQLQTSAEVAKESTYFKSAEIMVTNARFVVGAKTFAMRGITSVEAVESEEVVEIRSADPVASVLAGIITLAGLLIIGAGFICWIFYEFSLWVVFVAGVIGGVMLGVAGSLNFINYKKRGF